MARVIPNGGITDQTSFFAARNAAADDALARLFMSLLARREERERLYEQQKELLGIRHQHDWDKTQYLYPPGTDPTTNNPLAKGTGTGGAVPPPPAAAPTASAAPLVYPSDPPPGGRTLPGGAGILPGGGSFAPGAALPNTRRGDAVSGGGSDDFVVGGAGTDNTNALRDTFASLEMSSQNRREPTVRGGSARSGQPVGTMKLPARSRSRVALEFQPIHQDWLNVIDATEQKYGLPKGLILATYGYENAGGAKLGKNSSSDADGMFQFTDATRKQHGVRYEDRNNPAVMIDALGRNYAFAAKSLDKSYGIKLAPDAKYIPHWITLHQFGPGDGSRIVRAHLSDSGQMRAADVMQKGADNVGKLVGQKNMPSNITVDDLMKTVANHSLPWFDAGIKYRQTQTQTPPPTPPETVPPTGATQPPPPRTIQSYINNPPDASTAGVNPRLVAAVRGGASLALPPGYTLRVVSGHRPQGNPSSHHYRGNAADFQIYAPNGVPIPHKGEDTTGLYTRLARGVKTWAQENDPQLVSQIGYGGAFGTQLGGGGVPDLMHYDLGGSRGRMRPDVQFAKLQVLAANERNAPVQTAAPTPAPTPVPAPKPQLRPTVPSEWGGLSGAKDSIPTFGVKEQPPIAVADVFGGMSPNPVLQSNRTPRRFNVAQSSPPDEMAKLQDRIQQQTDVKPETVQPAEVPLPAPRPANADEPQVRLGWGGPTMPLPFPDDPSSKQQLIDQQPTDAPTTQSGTGYPPSWESQMPQQERVAPTEADPNAEPPPVPMSTWPPASDVTATQAQPPEQIGITSAIQGMFGAPTNSPWYVPKRFPDVIGDAQKFFNAGRPTATPTPTPTPVKPQDTAQAIFDVANDSRQRAFDQALKNWTSGYIKDVQTDAQEIATDAKNIPQNVATANDIAQRGYAQAGDVAKRGFDAATQAMKEWWYSKGSQNNPIVVKTDKIGKNAPKPPVVTKQVPTDHIVVPPQELVPRRTTGGPAFSGPLVAPGGVVVAPPMPQGKPLMPGGGLPSSIQRIPDPTSPTGYKYETPAEKAAREAQTVEQPQPVE